MKKIWDAFSTETTFGGLLVQMIKRFIVAFAAGITVMIVIMILLILSDQLLTMMGI